MSHTGIQQRNDVLKRGCILLEGGKNPSLSSLVLYTLIHKLTPKLCAGGLTELFIYTANVPMPPPKDHIASLKEKSKTFHQTA